MRALLLGMTSVISCALFACGGDDNGGATLFEPDAGSDATAPVDGGGTSDATMSGCDRTKSPKQDPCVVSDDFGVFVAPAPMGSDTAQGTKAAPFATIGRALAAAKQAGKRVYACEGTYAENVVLDTNADGVSLFGGLACKDWSYDGHAAKVAPATTGYPLKIDGVTKDTTIEDFELDAKDGAAPGESSIAAFVHATGKVTLRRVKLVAGVGAKGSDGANMGGTANKGDNGNPANGTAGAPAKACTCVAGGSSTGGKGGTGDAINPTAGDPGLADPTVTGTAPKDGAGGGAGCNAGHEGANAPAGGGGDGAKTLGMLGASGWSPSAGAAGKSGGPGQGGGGAGGSTLSGGGGGACGGCGGAGGGPGGGGGSSIALAVVTTAVTLDGCTLVTANAGAGGVGGSGQAGGGGGSASGGACSGGAGGTGGSGGGGGGGAGGSSWGIAFVGAGPVQMGGTNVTIGALGAGGVGGAGAGQNGTNGVNGEAAQTKSF